MKAIRIGLLVLIIVGLGLIFTQSVWVPGLVNIILNDQGATQPLAVLETAPVKNTIDTALVPKPSNGPQAILDKNGNKTGFTKNSNTVSYHGQVQEIDPASFQIIFSANGSSTLYSKDGGNVYYIYNTTDSSQLITVPGANPSTFAVNNVTCVDIMTPECYYDAYDSTHKFFQGQVASPAPTINIDQSALSASPGQPILSGTAFGTDKIGVQVFNATGILFGSGSVFVKNNQWYVKILNVTQPELLPGAGTKLTPGNYTIKLYAEPDKISIPDQTATLLVR